MGIMVEKQDSSHFSAGDENRTGGDGQGLGGIVALVGPSGSGKSSWLRDRVPHAHWLKLVPEETALPEMRQWRLGYLLGMDALFTFLLDDCLVWRCPKCGQVRVKNSIKSLAGQLAQDFRSGVRIGFPYSGTRETLVNKGFWRIMSDEGVIPLPEDEWIEADIVVDRLNLSHVNSVRLAEALEQCLVSGLGAVVVRDDGRRIVYGLSWGCEPCGQEAAPIGSALLLNWVQGKKELDAGLSAFSRDGVDLTAYLSWSIYEWLAEEPRLHTETWWTPWAERLQRLDGLGLGDLSPAQKLGTLSSGERALALLGRCWTWSVSGYDFVFEHAQTLLFGPDRDVFFQVCRELATKGNRIWLETHDDCDAKACDRVLTFGDDPFSGGEDDQSSAAVVESWESDWMVEQIVRCRDRKRGGVWVQRGPRGSGKTRWLRNLFAALVNLDLKGYKTIDRLDSDPWDRGVSREALIEVIGLWDWLTQHTITQPQARIGRLLPGHFDRKNPLGACPTCLGSYEALAVCPDCLGTGLGPQVRGLKFAGRPLAEFWLRPLAETIEGLGALLPGWLQKRCCAFERTGLTQSPGGRVRSDLSRNQDWGVTVLTFLWNIHYPAILGLDEPFRGLDERFSRLVREEMLEMGRKGAVVMWTTSKRTLPAGAWPA
jgi:hypothetical protein